LTDIRTLASAISQDSSFGIKDQEIRLGTGEFAHDRARSISTCDLQLNDTVMLDLANIVESGTLEVGS
jgi:hypothetical protein